MIISHQYKYLFIEIPHTASWAIHQELRDHYSGEAILHKHANYSEFARQASEEEKGYLKFATVRHPLDEAVSGFYKLKTNHKGAFSDPEALKAGIVTESNIARYKSIQENNIEFEDKMRHYRGYPYDSMITYSEKHLDFVIRYEKLQHDFAQVLALLDIEQVGPIPTRNKTASRRKEWQSYYVPEMYETAAQRYGPFMKQWGYEFPAEWGIIGYRKQDAVLFKFLKVGRRFYATNIRYKDNPLAKRVRAMRARMR